MGIIAFAVPSSHAHKQNALLDKNAKYYTKRLNETGTRELHQQGSLSLDYDSSVAKSKF